MGGAVRIDRQRNVLPLEGLMHRCSFSSVSCSPSVIYCTLVYEFVLVLVFCTCTALYCSSDGACCSV